MKSSLSGLLLMAGTLLVLLGAGCRAASAQATGDEFFSDPRPSGDEFASGGSFGSNGWEDFFYSDSPTTNISCIYAPRPIQQRVEGRWVFLADGSDQWQPADDGFESNAYTFAQDATPPGRTRENFSDSEKCDEFAPLQVPNSAYSIQRQRMRWPADHRFVRVYISGTVCQARNGQVKRVIQDCLDEWCKSLGNKVSYEISSDFRQSDIYYLQRDTQSNEWADNERSYDRKGLETVKISLQERTVQYLNERRLRAVLLHETGHAFGLIDHLPGRDDAMSLYTCDEKAPVAKLSSSDKAAVQDLYSNDVWHGLIPSRQVISMQPH